VLISDAPGLIFFYSYVGAEFSDVALPFVEGNNSRSCGRSVSSNCDAARKTYGKREYVAEDTNEQIRSWTWCMAFTIGFLHLAFWKRVLAIVLWPYYLGVRFSALAR
jgi:hypothetical protein